MAGRLPEKYRTAVQYYAIEGRSQKEIAKAENLSLSGAKSRVQRGRGMLKRMLLSRCRFEYDIRRRIIDFLPIDGGRRYFKAGMPAPLPAKPPAGEAGGAT